LNILNFDFKASLYLLKKSKIYGFLKASYETRHTKIAIKAGITASSTLTKSSSAHIAGSVLRIPNSSSPASTGA